MGLREGHGLWGPATSEPTLQVFKVGEQVVRNGKIVTAKMATEPKSEKKGKKSTTAFYTGCS